MSDDEDVIAIAGVSDIVAGPGIQTIIAGFAVDDIVTITTNDDVVSGPREDDVVTVASIDEIVTVAGKDQIVTAAAKNDVVTVATVDQVVTCQAIDDIGTAMCDDVVSYSGANQDVVAVGGEVADESVFEQVQCGSLSYAEFTVGNGIAERDLADVVQSGSEVPRITIAFDEVTAGRDEVGYGECITVGVSSVRQKVGQANDERSVDVELPEVDRTCDHGGPIALV